MVTRKTKKLVYNTIVIALLVIGIGYVCSRFLHLGSVEYTDNAQVKQHITPVNTRVQGFIKKIYFEEYQSVHKGDTLLVIEDAALSKWSKECPSASVCKAMTRRR